MPSTYTTNLRLEKQAAGENDTTWGVRYNTQLDLIDSAVGGVTGVSVTGQTNITLTAGTGTSDQARAFVLVATGTLTSDCTILYPATVKVVLFYNSVTNANPSPYAILLGQVGGTPLRLRPGAGGLFFLDGANVNVLGGGELTLTRANLSSDLTVAGTATAGAFVTTSDARVKSDVRTITDEDGARWVREARPVQYRIGDSHAVGFLAQDQAKAGYWNLTAFTPDPELPETTDKDGFTSPAGQRLGLDFIQTIAYLTAHAQSLDARLAALEAAHGR